MMMKSSKSMRHMTRIVSKLQSVFKRGISTCKTSHVLLRKFLAYQKPWAYDNIIIATNSVVGYKFWVNLIILNTFVLSIIKQWLMLFYLVIYIHAVFISSSSSCRTVT